MTASISLILTFAIWADHWGRDAGEAIDAEENIAEVDRNWPLLIFVALGVIGAPILALVFLQEVSGDLAPLNALEVFVIVILESFALFVTAALLWLIQITLRTRFTAEGISQPSGFGLRRSHVIRWEDVRRLEWRGAGLEFRLISADTKIGLCIYFFHQRQLLRLFDTYLQANVDMFVVSTLRRSS